MTSPLSPITVNYANIRNDLQTGDLLVFGGFFLGSKIIKLATRSQVSHVAIVLRHPKEDRLSLFEVSTGKHTPEHNGVNTHKISNYVPFYHGNVWVLQLKDAVRATFQSNSLRPFIENTLGRSYDIEGAGLAGWDIFENVQKKARPRSPHYFCSELVAEAYMCCGILPSNIHPEEITPVDLTRLNIYKDTYYQIKKKKCKTIALQRNVTTPGDLPTVAGAWEKHPYKYAKSMANWQVIRKFR